VAIKKVSEISRSTGTLKQILREVRLMRKMDDHPLTVSLLDLYQRESKDEIYLVMELMTTDLHQVIQSDQALTGLHIQHFTYQILKGIEFIHSCGVLHRDLKPGNILVNTSCDLKIADFGLSRTSADSGMTELVVTRWYRAPELILNPNGGYGKSVDLWSIGCIFAELLGRKPLFPGKQFVHQLELIFEVLGTPQPEDVAYVTNPNALDFLRDLKPKDPVPFSKIFPHVSVEALDFVERLLQFREADRMTTEDCLAHPFMEGAELNCQLPEITVPTDMECLFENFRLSKSKLKKVIAKEVAVYKRKRGELILGQTSTANATASSRDQPKPPTDVDGSKQEVQSSQKAPPTKEEMPANPQTIVAEESQQTEDTDKSATSPVQGSPHREKQITPPPVEQHNNADAQPSSDEASTQGANTQKPESPAVPTDVTASAVESESADSAGGRSPHTNPPKHQDKTKGNISNPPVPTQNAWGDTPQAITTQSHESRDDGRNSKSHEAVSQEPSKTPSNSLHGESPVASKEAVKSSHSVPSSDKQSVDFDRKDAHNQESPNASDQTGGLTSDSVSGNSPTTKMAAATQSMVEKYRALVRKSRTVSRSATESSQQGGSATKASTSSRRRSYQAASGLSRLDRLVRGVPVFHNGDDSPKGAKGNRSSLRKTSSTSKLLKKQQREKKKRSTHRPIRKSLTQPRRKVTMAYSPKWTKRRTTSRL